MLALAAANAVGVVLFGVLYTLAGTGHLGQNGFLACLLLVFGLVTALWIRTEARHRSLEPVRRLGRAVIGLVLVIIGTPVAVLMPVFSLDEQLPLEAGIHGLRGPIMTLVFIALTMTALTNVAGAVVIGLRAALTLGRHRSIE